MVCEPAVDAEDEKSGCRSDPEATRPENVPSPVPMCIANDGKRKGDTIENEVERKGRGRPPACKAHPCLQRECVIQRYGRGKKEDQAEEICRFIFTPEEVPDETNDFLQGKNWPVYLSSMGS